MAWNKLGTGDEFPDALAAAAKGIHIAYRGVMHGRETEQVEIELESHFDPYESMPGMPCWQLRVAKLTWL